MQRREQWLNHDGYQVTRILHSFCCYFGCFRIYFIMFCHIATQDGYMHVYGCTWSKITSNSYCGQLYKWRSKTLLNILCWIITNTRIECQTATNFPNFTFVVSIESRDSQVSNDGLLANFQAIHGKWQPNRKSISIIDVLEWFALVYCASMVA